VIGHKCLFNPTDHIRLIGIKIYGVIFCHELVRISSTALDSN
jgi:hypothetical protein